MLKAAMSHAVNSIVDFAGGVRVVLPGGHPARVAYHCRALGQEFEPQVMERYLAALRPDA